jgi:hypothetical protein
MFQIQVNSRIIGRLSFTLEPVILPITQERLTVAELITRTVQEQVKALNDSRLSPAQIQQTLARQYLTPEEIDAQVSQNGAIRYPTAKKPPAKQPAVNPQPEIAKALNGFAAKNYQIIVGGQTMERLDQEITLRPTTKVTFLRLTPLVGG